MKKLFVLMAMVLPFALSVSAQTQDQIAASQKRAADLQTLLDKWPASTGEATIDEFASSVCEAAKLAIENSNKLATLCAKANDEGEKPNVAEATDLSLSIVKEASEVTNATKAAVDAGKAAKDNAEQVKNEKNPMKVAKMAKQAKAITETMDASSKALEILAVESVEQGKMIANLIETLKAE